MAHPYYMPLYFADYLADTMTLNMTEHGAYLLMLGYAWTNHGELPPDMNEIYTLARTRTDSDRAAVDKVLARFWDRSSNGSGGFVNKRLSHELAHATALISKRSLSGKSGAAARWGNRIPIANADAIRPSPYGNRNGRANDSPIKKYGGANANASASANAIAMLNQDQVITPPTAVAVVGVPAAAHDAALQRNSASHDSESIERAATATNENLDISWNKNSKCFDVSEATALRWQAAFPDLRVPEKIDQCSVWLAAHQEHMPKPEHYEAFLVRWLLREEQNGPITPS